jgi:hypothetical protein
VNLIAYFRSPAFTNNPNLLWLSGTVSASSSSFDATIQTCMLNVDTADNRAFYMNTDDLAFIDGLHFNGWSNVVFGNWLAQRYLENVL